MKTIELYHYGVDEVLGILTRILTEGVNSKFKKQKDKAICEAIGSVKTLRDLIVITDNDDNEEVEEENKNDESK